MNNNFQQGGAVTKVRYEVRDGEVIIYGGDKSAGVSVTRGETVAMNLGLGEMRATRIR